MREGLLGRGPDSCVDRYLVIMARLHGVYTKTK